MSGRILNASRARLITVLAFVVACVAFFAYLWAQAGGYVPGFSEQRDFSFTFTTDNVVNVVDFADVMVAGVPVGKVDSIVREGGRMAVTASVDRVAAPLHEGARVQISEKSLAGQPMVRLEDGVGPELENGVRLPDHATKPAVTVRDVLTTFDPRTRTAMGSTVRALDAATAGRGVDVHRTVSGLAEIARNGQTALDALSAQSADLEQIPGELAQAFDALDTQRGQIADLVTDADRVTSATAGQRENLEGTIRRLPRTLELAQGAAAQFNRLAPELQPITADLRRAAPDVDAVLRQLPGTTKDLRQLLPTLRTTLDKAPATLDRVPRFSQTTRDLVPPTTNLLRDLNPALRYLKPYGPEIAQLITNFGAAFHHYGDDGQPYVYLKPFFQPDSIRPNPITLPDGGAFGQVNHYPAPGGLADLRPLQRPFPTVERDRK